MKKKLTVLLIAVSMAAALTAADLTHITILGTSDMHGNIIGWSYEDGKATTNNGMARLYTYIQQVREENPNTLLIDDGDIIQGTIMTDDLYAKNPDWENPVIAAMNYMKFDSATLGNHEFNWGITTLKKIMGQADFPVLGANILNPDGSYVTGLGWTMLEVAGVKIAVIGVCTPNIPIWDGGKEGIDETIYLPAQEAVKTAIAEIGDTADIIYVSAHMGMYAEFDEENGGDSGQKILDENPEVDILQVGHMHIIVNEKQGAVPIGAVRNSGRDIARFDIYVDENKEIVDASVDIIDMKNYEPSQELINLPIVQESHNKAVEYINGGSGDSEDGEYVGLGSTTAKFQPENEIRGIPEGKLRDTAVIEFINKVQLEVSGADVSSVALFKNTSDLPEGVINYGNIFDIYKYDNVLYRVPVTGAELKAYMEWSAECYNQWVPGDINISFDPEYPDYLYDMFAGVDYELDLSQPKGSRVKNVMFKGEPLQDDQKLTLAVNNYRYSSGLKAYKLVTSSKEWESSGSIRDYLVAYFAEHSPVEPTVDNNWRIVGVDLCEDDPRRAELVALINEGKLDPPYAKSYNLADYDELIAKSQEAKDVFDVEELNH